MPTIIDKPTRIESAGNKPKIIDEYIGQINSGHKELSIAHMNSPGGWTEPGQSPQFDEYTIVIRGILSVKTKDSQYQISAGQAIIAKAGEWVQYSTPEKEGAEYIAVCTPAFGMDIVNRDE